MYALFFSYYLALNTWRSPNAGPRSAQGLYQHRARSQLGGSHSTRPISASMFIIQLLLEFEVILQLPSHEQVFIHKEEILSLAE